MNWALTGEDVTDQGKAAPVKIGVGAALGIGVAAIAVGGLIASSVIPRKIIRKRSDSLLLMFFIALCIMFFNLIFKVD